MSKQLNPTNMKKYILTTLALAAVTLGCTKSSFVDVPEAQTTPITFETYTGKTPTTKATEKTTLSLAKTTASAFHVKAFYNSSLYMNKDVKSTCTFKNEAKTEIDKQGWDYDGTVYWPAAGDVTFYAYGISQNLTPNSAANDETSYTYTVPATVSTQDDLIVAVPVTQAGTSNNTTVSLDFRHLLSRVGFKLTTTKESESLNVTINSITLNGTFYNAGTVDITTQTTPAIAATTTGDNATRTSYSLFESGYKYVIPSPGPTNAKTIFGNTDSKNVTSTDDSNRFMMLIPGGVVTSATVEYILPNQSSPQRVTASLTSEITLAAGKAYEFIINLSTDAIEFTGEVMDWDETHDDYTQNI